MKYIYNNDISELDKLAVDVEEFFETNLSDFSICNAFSLCLDELFTNIVSYAYKKGQDKKIELELELNKNLVVAKISDYGEPFNPLENAKEPDLEASIEDRQIGGLGIFFCKKMMDKLIYERTCDNKNQISLEKIIS